MAFKSLAFFVTLVSACSAFSVKNSNFNVNTNINNNDKIESSRRQLLKLAPAAALAIFLPDAASAGIDPSALQSLKVEGDNNGSVQRLRQLKEETGPKIEDLVDIPFIKSPSGISYREYREGKGEVTVKQGSKVAVETTIRCKSFSTAKEPGGLTYFTTKGDTAFNELAWVVGDGELLPGLEEGMMGMRKGGIRRIEVPSTLVFAARNDEQLPLPSANNKDGKRIYDRLFKTDATLLFEVLVTRVK
eukprot:scaffold2748_cov179-Chaetoceros_neogracile.AAC.1